MTEYMKCPKCGGEMEEGFIMDRGYTSLTKLQWGTKFKKLLYMKVAKLENQRETTTYRCKSCGFLESWAK